MKISVLIPMYNESAIVADTFRTLAGAMRDYAALSGNEYEIIFSDDGSTDGSADIVRRVITEEKVENVRVIGYADNRGKGSAVREAVLASTGDIVIYTDCDLAYGTDVIGRLVDAFQPETDIVVGSRRLDKDGYAEYTFLRRIASGAYVALLRLLTGFKLSDSQCGCKAMRGETGRSIFAACETDGFAFDQEFLMRAERRGCVIAEMPVRVVNHRASSVHLVRDAFRMIRDVLKIKKTVAKTEQ
ncbi:MAG: glycosyltransferase [Clostridia bacterium]|nr:glycosyltransferase [Clostridia bacterium]